MESILATQLFEGDQWDFFDALWRHYSILTAEEFIENGRSEKWERLCEIRDEAAGLSL